MKIGILDPGGKNKNPLNNSKYSEKYKELAKIWSMFPAYDKPEEYINIIKGNQVILVVSGTGSGKTVLFPKYTLHSYNYNARIGITLPKQIITRSAAEFASKTLDVELGKEVGYKYRGSPHNSRSVKTKLLYATDGTIVAKLLFDPSLKDFDAIIVDEAHERKVQIDFLLYLLKETLKVRKDFKIIIMSATVNYEIFQNYFKQFKFYNLNIGGKTNYKIESIFLENKINTTQYIEKGIEIILKILKEDDITNEGSHDILFFITSVNEARNVCKVINAKSKNPNLFCVEVYAGMDKELQEYAQDDMLFKKDGKYNRKIVIATNVAESSLTIKGIKYVIDCGYELQSSYDIKLKGKKLEKTLISHAQAKQRMGRTGRTEPGICYHLYTKDEFENKMRKFPEPNIRVQDITEECLKLLNADKIKNFKVLRKMLKKFIEPPDSKYIDLAYENLINFKLIDKKNRINKLGEIVTELSIEPVLGLAVVYSYFYGCLNEVINIVSLITASNYKMNDIFKNAEKILKNDIELRSNKKLYEQELKKLQKKIKVTKKNFHHPSGDHLSILNLYKDFNEIYSNNDYNEDLYQWCEDNYVIYNTLMKAKKYAIRNKKLYKSVFKKYKLNKLDKDIHNNDNIDNNILKCFHNSSVHIANKSSNKNGYLMKHFKKIDVQIDSNSFLQLNKKLPNKVIYHELFISKLLKNETFTINIVSVI